MMMAYGARRLVAQRRVLLSRCRFAPFSSEQLEDYVEVSSVTELDKTLSKLRTKTPSQQEQQN